MQVKKQLLLIHRNKLHRMMKLFQTIFPITWGLFNNRIEYGILSSILTLLCLHDAGNTAKRQENVLRICMVCIFSSK